MNNLRHITILTSLLAITLMVSVLLPQVAFCSIQGSIDLGYTDFRKQDSTQNYSASSFSQQYSLMYNTGGLLTNGRLGRYDLSLGYEWLGYNTSARLSEIGSAITTSDISGSRGHLNYSGEVVLNPKELPLKMTLYSKDMYRSSFSTEAAGNANADSSASGYKNLASGLIQGVDNGTHTVSGVTLIAGVKNGMTNGYNEVLRHFPMLMLDYKDEINKDLAREFPVNNRLTRLAFVSLNKKNNWFHFRYVTYDDKIDSDNNYEESQLQLGTIDHTLKRLWIDFSNWLSVSADGQLTKNTKVLSGQDYEDFSLNLFAAANRKDWQLRTYNSFIRLNEITENLITYQTSLPVYASGIISPTAIWSATASYKNHHTDNNESFTSLRSAYSVDAYRKSPFTLRHGMSAENYKDSSGTGGLLFSGNVDMASTAHFSREFALNASYKTDHRISESIGDKAYYTKQTVAGDVNYNVTNKLRISAEQSFGLGHGQANAIQSSVDGASVVSDMAEGSQDEGESYGTSFTSSSIVKAKWNPLPRMFMDLSAKETLYKHSSGTNTSTSKIGVAFQFKGINANLISTNNYNLSNDSNDSESDTFTSKNSAKYVFNRNLDAGANVNYEQQLGVGSARPTISWEQSLNYRHFAASGMLRKLVEVSEVLSSTETVDTTGQSRSRVNTATLGVRYYPLRQLMLGGGAKYSFLNRGTDASLSYYGTLAIQFRLLSASVDYTYGKSSSDDNLIEKKLTANVKKVF